MKTFLIKTGFSEEEQSFNPLSLSRFIKEKAINEGVLEIDKNNCGNTAIFLGVTLGNFFRRYSFYRDYLRGGIRKVNPANFPKLLISYSATYLAKEFGIKGANCTFSSGSSAGLDAFSAAIPFLRKDKKRQVLILELGEKIDEESETARVKVAFCHLRSSLRLRERRCLTVLSLESFFEKSGENQGLVKAVRRALLVSSLSFREINFFFVSRPPGSEGYALEQKTVKSFIKDKKIGSLLSVEGDAHCSGLFSLAWVLKNEYFNNSIDKKGSNIMFVSLGWNSNSSCLILKKV